jgi:16S rRNA (guanine1207-N2)-methyltransferase
MDEDVYFHKTVTLRAGGANLRFRTSQELFSSHDVDTGTRFLLRGIIAAGHQPKQILDLGCGYGPLGLALRQAFPDSTAHLVDRDALAVAYARQNARLNGTDDADIYGSLGYDDVKRNDFDLIVSNIPGKAGETVIACLLSEAGYYLSPGGIAAIVVVAALEPLAAKVLEDTSRYEIVFRDKRAGHAIFHYRTRDIPEQAAPSQNKPGAGNLPPAGNHHAPGQPELYDADGLGPARVRQPELRQRDAADGAKQAARPGRPARRRL